MQQIELVNQMIRYYSGDPRRIQHFLKVFEFARMIGKSEKIEKIEQEILETAAIVHDIGIKIAEEKYGNCDGKMQEKEGPAKAEELLRSLGYQENIIERVSYLVGHHHTYTEIEGLDYQILVEADFLVNLFEDNASEDAIRTAYNRIFRTESGKRICKDMFGI